MKWTLKEMLKQCRLALKKNTSKRDKWVKDWAGQVILNTIRVKQVAKELFSLQCLD
jgi:dynein heavy chain